MASDGRNKILESLVMERDLRTSGFRLALRELMEQILGEYDGDEFREWFGDCDVVPAAFKIEGSGGGAYDYTVHVYEIEWSQRLAHGKLGFYADCADGEGPHFTLHLIDRAGAERVMADSDLWCTWHREELARQEPSHSDPPPVLAARKAGEKIETHKKRSINQREREKLALEIVQQMGIKI